MHVIKLLFRKGSSVWGISFSSSPHQSCVVQFFLNHSGTSFKTLSPLTQHNAVWGLGLGAQAQTVLIQSWPTTKIRHGLMQEKAWKTHTFTRRKLCNWVKEEIGCPSILFLEGNRVTLALICFLKKMIPIPRSLFITWRLWCQTPI